METLEITTHSAVETQDIAHLFAREIATSDVARKGALMVALEGDLGGGKTTFAQGFARAFGVRERVLSPTFVIMKRFKIYNVRFKNFIHIDAYRIESLKELRAIGWWDILKDKETIVLVEWADRVRRALPKGYIRIQFEFINESERKIIM